MGRNHPPIFNFNSSLFVVSPVSFLINGKSDGKMRRFKPLVTSPWLTLVLSRFSYLFNGNSYNRIIVLTRKVSNIRRTKSPNLHVSNLVLQLSLLNPLKPGVKSGMKM